MIRKSYFATIAAFAFFALAAGLQPASAQWTDAERSACRSSCTATCEKNPNVSASQRNRCPEYCSCACLGSEAVSQSYRQFNEELGGNQDTVRTRAIKAIIPACNARAFGG